MNDCRTCIRFRSTTCEGGWLETCGDNGRSIAFARADIGIYGELHCGPEGKYWEGKK